MRSDFKVGPHLKYLRERDGTEEWNNRNTGFRIRKLTLKPLYHTKPRSSGSTLRFTGNRVLGEQGVNTVFNRIIQ